MADLRQLVEAARKRGLPQAPLRVPMAPLHAPVQWLPKQQRALDSNARFLLLAAGVRAGKSITALGKAISRCHLPGHPTLYLRKTSPELEAADGPIALSKRWLVDGRDGIWKPRTMRWEFQSGATLQFGHCAKREDAYRYRGGQYGLIIFDEADSFDLASYLEIITRAIKRIDDPWDVQVMLTGNPPTRGRLWVRQMFMAPDAATRQDLEVIKMTLRDNPFIDYDEVAQQFKDHDYATRQALLEGDWDVAGGNLVYPLAARCIAANAPALPQDARYTMGIDLGASIDKPTTAWVVLAASPSIPNHVYVLESACTTELNTDQMVQLIRSKQDVYPRLGCVMDHGGLGAALVRDLAQTYGLPVVPATKAKRLLAQQMLRGALERNELTVVGPQNGDLINQMADLRLLEDGTQAEGPDHICDALLYAYRTAKPTAMRAVEPEPDEGLLSPFLQNLARYDRYLTQQAKNPKRKKEFWEK